jgi:hypothetical protein
VSSNSPLISKGYGSPFTIVNGFISRNEKSKSEKGEQDFVNMIGKETLQRQEVIAILKLQSELCPSLWYLGRQRKLL